MTAVGEYRPAPLLLRLVGSLVVGLLAGITLAWIVFLVDDRIFGSSFHGFFAWDAMLALIVAWPVSSAILFRRSTAAARRRARGRQA
jgi:hypothetical protein